MPAPRAGPQRRRPPPLALARVHLAYWWRHRRLLDLADPQLFTEWVQHRKLHDREPRLPRLADKLTVKRWVAARLGPGWVIPTWWSGAALPRAPRWPAPFVVKARHGCRQNGFVHDVATDWAAVRRRAARWSGRRYGYWLDEWLYGEIPCGLLVEPFMGVGRTLPLDYKCYVFGGRVEFVQVHYDRAGLHRWVVMDRRWRRASAPGAGPDPTPPASLGAIMAAAEALAEGHEFVRADFYEIARRPLFGELTFYPGSGLDPFNPVALDRRMGAHWRAARAGAGRPA